MRSPIASSTLVCEWASVTSSCGRRLQLSPAHARTIVWQHRKRTLPTPEGPMTTTGGFASPDASTSGCAECASLAPRSSLAAAATAAGLSYIAVGAGLCCCCCCCCCSILALAVAAAGASSVWLTSIRSATAAGCVTSAGAGPANSTAQCGFTVSCALCRRARAH